MNGLHILMHSMRMVSGNLGAALRIGLVPGAILLGCAAVLFVGLAPMVEQAMAGEKTAFGTYVFGFMTVFIGFILAVVMFAVNWHRFILLEEYPSGLGLQFHGREMLSYFGIGFLLALILILPMMLALMVVASIAMALQSAGAATVLSFLISFVFSAVFLRLGVVLPAVAIRKKIRIGQAWDATSGHMGDFLMLAVVMAVLQTVLEQAGPLLGQSVMAVVVLVAGNLFFAVVNISVLTTLYGHYIEGRPLTS